jgi:hypothetical protein
VDVQQEGIWEQDEISLDRVYSVMQSLFMPGFIG